MDTFLPTHPEDNWSLLRRSIRLYRVSLKKVFLLSLLLAITAFIPRLLSYATGEDLLQNMTPFSTNQLWMGLLNFISFIFFIGIIWHMHCVIIGKREPLKEDVSIGFRKSIAVFIAATLQGLLVLGIAAIVIGSQVLLKAYQPWLFEEAVTIWLVSLFFVAELALLVYVGTLFLFIVPLIAIENNGILSALQKSVSLVWNHCWRTIKLQATPWIVFVFLLALLKFVLGLNIHIYFMKAEHSTLLLSLLQMLLFAIFVPWVAATLLVQLQDLELRKKAKQ